MANLECVIADGSPASSVRERMRELCEPFGTELETIDGGLQVAVSPSPRPLSLVNRT